MRAPSYKGLRDDKAARAVVRELPEPEVESLQAESGGDDPGAGAVQAAGAADPISTSPEELFDSVTRAADGVLRVVVGGRQLKLSNWDKVLFPAAGFTKGQLITYYADDRACGGCRICETGR